MVDALHAAVQSGQLTKARIDESVRRILLLKLRFGLLPLPPSAGQRDVTLAPASSGPASGSATSGQALVPDQRRERRVAAA
jgi:beta-glucosidase-like glycosyl hydrolase